MSWADNIIKRLQQDIPMGFNPRGNSMIPKIKSGEFVTVTPTRDTVIEVGMIVLCKVSGNQYLHFVKAIDGDRYQIGNAHGYVNGWTNREHIYGIVTAIGEIGKERFGRHPI